METSNTKKLNNGSLFPVVCIGTAESEIDILKIIISELEENSGMAYVILENLDKSQSENLAEELAKHTKIPVQEIVNDINLQPDHIYVIPENNFLILENGKLALQLKTRSSTNNNCTDLFFESLASIYQGYTIGLLISATPLDGIAGLKNIKELGGATLTILSQKGIPQNPNTEDFIDYFILPSSIASKLTEIQNSYILNHAYEEGENEDLTDEEEQLFNKIIEILSLKTGTNFHHYKNQTLRRRIAKRMVTTRQESIEKYFELLKNNVSEQNALFNDILIPVSYFFREKDFFDKLSVTVFPTLIENLHKDSLRFWSAGCSTGEEAYSLAICIHEYLEQTKNLHIKIQIFASDISEHCIAKARTGFYTHQDVKNISEKRLEQYFTKTDSGYYISKTIRDMCVFAVHDLTKDAPFSKIDLIVCRNVLIYFDSYLQNQILASFHYSLRNIGFLFLGKSESATQAPNLFTIAAKHEKIYARKSNEEMNKKLHFNSSKSLHKTTNPVHNNSETETDYKKIATDVLLQQYSPAAVIVNEELEIVYFHGDTSPFLQPASGKPSFNILNMVRDEIGFELRNALLRSRNEKKNIVGGHIAVKKQPFLTSFEVIYLPSNIDLLLIIFCKVQTPYSDQVRSGELEKELHQLRGDFKRVTEEQQIYFEELQTTNEELLANTEELQLINEQLTATAEELQSNNEELSCINDELQDRRDELATMRNFYESIVKTIHEPMIVIDENAIIKSANPSFYKYFKTTQAETEGGSLFEVGNFHWNISEFKENVLKKLSSQEIVENFKIQFSLENGLKKTMILNASRIVDSIPEGMILIALEDITDLELSNESIKNKNLELLSYNKQLESFTAAASHNLLEPGRKIYMFGKKILDSEKTITEAGKHNLKRLLSSAVNLNQLIEDLIEYSKINFDAKTFKKTDLNIIAKKTVTELKTIISKHQAEILIDPLPVLNIIPTQIQKLFWHLITNAIKYAQKNISPKIKISAEDISNEEISALGENLNQNYVKLTFSDNGIGFAKDFENLIFEPFYKLHSNELHYGSGLGLTLVQKIVLNHKGFIRVSSKPLNGTSICIYLPA